MEFTIITLGDIETFRATLTAIAMLFNPSNTTDFVGTSDIGLGGFAAVGLLIALTVALFKGVSTLKFELGELIVVIILYSAMFVPKFDVILEDYYSGDVAAVDDVPLGIALPGAFISGFTTQISETLSTAFKTASSPAYAMQENGFVYPLKLLNALRNGSGQFAKTQPEVSTSIINIYKDCAFGRDGFSSTKMSRDNNPWTYIKDYIETNSVQGLTEVYSPTAPNGETVTCQDAANMVGTSLDLLFEPGANPDIPVSSKNPGGVSKFEEMICANMKNVRTKNKGCPDYLEYESAFQVVGAASGEAAKNFAITTMVASSVKNAELCAAGGTSAASIAQCLPMVTALEQYKEDAVGGATMFQKTMLNSMSVMLFLFYAFAPLVSVLMIVMGAKGIKLLGSYMMFGIWTQSWLPFATVLNFYIQQKVNTDSARFGANSPELSAAGYQAFYESVSINLAIASDLMAATPLITLALLSGSIFALTGVANRLSGRDYYDEKVNAPTAVQQGAIAMNTPSFTGATGLMSAKSGDLKAPAIQVGSALQSSEQTASMASISNAAAAQKSIESSMMKKFTETGSFDKMVQFAKDNNATRTEGFRSAVNAVADNSDGSSSAAAQAAAIRYQEQNENKDTLTFGGKAGFGLGKKGGGPGGAVEMGYTNSSINSDGTIRSLDNNDTTKRETGQGTKISGQGGYETSSPYSSALSTKEQIGIAQKLAKSLDATGGSKEVQSLSQMATIQDQAIRTLAQTNSMGNQSTIDSPQLVAALNNDDALSGKIMTAGGNFMGDGAFRDRFNQNLNAYLRTDAASTIDSRGNNVADEMAMLQTLMQMRPAEGVTLLAENINPALSGTKFDSPTPSADSMFEQARNANGLGPDQGPNSPPPDTAKDVNAEVEAGRDQATNLTNKTNKATVDDVRTPSLGPIQTAEDLNNPAKTQAELDKQDAKNDQAAIAASNKAIESATTQYGQTQRNIATSYEELSKEGGGNELRDYIKDPHAKERVGQLEDVVSSFVERQAEHPSYTATSEYAHERAQAIAAQTELTSIARDALSAHPEGTSGRNIVAAFVQNSERFTEQMADEDAAKPQRNFSKQGATPTPANEEAGISNASIRESDALRKQGIKRIQDPRLE